MAVLTKNSTRTGNDVTVGCEAELWRMADALRGSMDAADVQPNDRAVCSMEFLVLRQRPPVDRAFAYSLARSPVFRQQIEDLVTETSKSHQRAQASSFLALTVERSRTSLVEAFERVAELLLERSLQCRRESRVLVALCDALLPKLIFGELRVKDAEFVGGHGG
jgi:hypothetical protein